MYKRLVSFFFNMTHDAIILLKTLLRLHFKVMLLQCNYSKYAISN